MLELCFQDAKSLYVDFLGWKKVLITKLSRAQSTSHLQYNLEFKYIDWVKWSQVWALVLLIENCMIDLGQVTFLHLNVNNIYLPQRIDVQINKVALVKHLVLAMWAFNNCSLSLLLSFYSLFSMEILCSPNSDTISSF